MRFLIVPILTIFVVVFGTSIFYLKEDITDTIWQSDEVILKQFTSVNSSTSGHYGFAKVRLSLIFFSEGVFSASVKGVVKYENGDEKKIMQELTGSWVRDSQYISMSLANSNRLKEYSNEEFYSRSLEDYSELVFDQTYKASFYKGRLILTSSHLDVGGPFLALSKK